MQGFAFIGMGVFVGVSLVVGTRLLIGAFRENDAPRAWIGITLLLAGALGPTATTAAGSLQLARPDLVPWLWGGGLGVLDLGVAALLGFTVSVFHRGSPAAMAAAGIAATGLAATLLGQWAVSGFDQIGHHDPFGFAGLALRAGSFFWAASASLAEYRRGRKRLALGLADPLVVNRFLLWGIGSGSACVIFAINFASHWAGHYDPTSFVSLTVVPGFGLIAAGAIATAFFPPAWYRARGESRS